MSIRIPIVAVVGRPNVGKSTFFNRVVGSKKAIVEDEPGITRDKNYASIESFSIPFYVIDTGGIDTKEDDELHKETRKQAISAVEEADTVIFLVDGRAGVQPADEDVLEILRSKKVPFIVVTNKCDGIELESLSADFYSLGVPEVFSCSALHNRKVTEVVEEVLSRLPNYLAIKNFQTEKRLREKEISAQIEVRIEEGRLELLEAEGWYDKAEDERELEATEKVDVSAQVDYFPPVFTPSEDGLEDSEYEKEYATLPVPASNRDWNLDDEDDSEDDTPEELELGTIRTAIIGRPNVGKSTLLNALTGKDRSIVSSIAGTTRDSIHEMFEYANETFELIDTAGMRKKGRIGDTVEKYSVLRSLNAIGECDVAVVLLCAEEGPTEQDAKIVGLAHDQGRGIVLVVNKWDAIEKDHTSVKKFEENIRDTFKFVPYAPLLFISAKNGRRVNRVLDEAIKVARSRKQRISTMRLNKLLRKEITRVSAPVDRGRRLKLYYAAQVDVAPPRFMLVMNYPRQAHFSYLRFIKNVIREKYGFDGTDIKLVTKKRGGGKAARQ